MTVNASSFDLSANCHYVQHYFEVPDRIFLHLCVVPTPEPLPPHVYWTTWYHMFIKGDYVFMQPMQEHDAATIRREHAQTPARISREV